MNDQDKKHHRCALRMWATLCRAVQQAHGTVPTYERMENMTVVEFMDVYAPNGVQFVFNEAAHIDHE